MREADFTCLRTAAAHDMRATIGASILHVCISCKATLS